VLLIVSVLAAFGVLLAVILGAGSYFFQGYIYSEPARGLAWRAPLAALGLTAFFGLWCFLDYRAFDPATPTEIPYHPYLFSNTRYYSFARLWSVREGRETEYTPYKTGSRVAGEVEFRDAQNRPWSPSAGGLAQALYVEFKDDPGQKVEFKADLTADGKFRGNTPHYVEAGGRHRVLSEEDVRRGELSVARYGPLFVMLFLNGFHFLLWFLGLWLLLRFQWLHALGLALVLWVATTGTLVQLLLSRTQELAESRHVAALGGTPATAGALPATFGGGAAFLAQESIHG
jgi:hypothetical protein